MGGRPVPSTAYRVTRLEPGTLMRWERPGGTWLWLLKPVGAGHTGLTTRLRSRYAWAKPTIVTELILMEIGDPFMMRKCLLGIRQRAGISRPDGTTRQKHGRQAESSRPPARVTMTADDPNDHAGQANSARHVIGPRGEVQTVTASGEGPGGTGTRGCCEGPKPGAGRGWGRLTASAGMSPGEVSSTREMGPGTPANPRSGRTRRIWQVRDCHRHGHSSWPSAAEARHPSQSVSAANYGLTRLRVTRPREKRPPQALGRRQ